MSTFLYSMYEYICTVSDVFVGFHVRSSYLIEFKYQASQNPLANAGDIRDTGSIPGSGGSPGGGNEDPLQYSCLKNPKDRGTWQTTVHRVEKSWTSGPIPCVCVSFGKSPRFYIVIYYILMSVYLRFP